LGVGREIVEEGGAFVDWVEGVGDACRDGGDGGG
jgi:hypothetical protein